MTDFKQKAREIMNNAIFEYDRSPDYKTPGVILKYEIEAIAQALKEAFEAGKRRCGVCLPDKPCNMEGCLNDTVPATNYNALNAKLAVAREALDSIATWEKWCGSSKCTCRQDMAKVALAALSPVTKDEGEK